MMPIAPPPDCPLCPRLVEFREQNRKQFPGFFNNPVPAFGALDAELLVVGLAPGLKGANATGRPFTGDYAGDILFPALLKAGFAKGHYISPRGETISGAYRDGLSLINCRISNAVRCVPQANKPEPSEIKNCNAFLRAEMAAMERLKVVLSLGQVSHNAVLKALGMKVSAAKFAHGAVHHFTSQTTNHEPRTTILMNSYHTSRYNMNVGTLTVAMFDGIIAQAKALIETSR